MSQYLSTRPASVASAQVRSEADQHAPRCLAVLRPLRVVLVNLPEDHFREVPARVREQGLRHAMCFDCIDFK